MSHLHQTPQESHVLLRPAFLILGFICLGLAILGFMLPMFPGIVFLMLSAACFARSSKRWHQWLLQNPTFGPMIEDWQAHRGISRRSKAIAIAVTLIFGSYSIIAMLDTAWMQWTAAAFMALGIGIIASFKSPPPVDQP